VEDLPPSWILFERDAGRLVGHPVTDGRDEGERVERVLSFTGQGLIGPEDSVPFLRLAPTARIAATREELRRAEPPDDRPSRWQAQGLALVHGRGRVVVMGEAAMLSSQLVDGDDGPTSFGGLSSPEIDNPQLVLNIVHWLAGTI
jgi:hypothetical protein